MSDDFKAEQEQLGLTIKEAANAIKSSIDDFSKAATESRDAAASAVKKAGANAADQLAALTDDAQHSVGRSVVNLTKSISTNPLAALAIAAGAGFLFGLAARGVRK